MANYIADTPSTIDALADTPTGIRGEAAVAAFREHIQQFAYTPMLSHLWYTSTGPLVAPPKTPIRIRRHNKRVFRIKKDKFTRRSTAAPRRLFANVDDEDEILPPTKRTALNLLK